MATQFRSLNEALADEQIAHTLDVSRYGKGVSKRMLALLDRVDKELSQELLIALESMDATSFKVQRLDMLLASVRRINRDVYAQMKAALELELKDFADAEWRYQSELFPSHGITVPVGVAQVTGAQVYAAATAQPFQSKLLSEWFDDINGLEPRRALRIRDAVRAGYLEGKTTESIVREVVGTRAGKYKDGIIQMDRHHAVTVVRSAVSHYAAVAQDEMLKGYGAILKGLVWTSTLDTKTSPMCRIRDGKLYTADDEHKPVGHKIPWLEGPGRLHLRCRSTKVALTKSIAEITGIPGLEDWPTGTRASMDGQVPADTTYAAWFKRQPAAVQDEIVGRDRGLLMRRGRLPFDSLYSDTGTPLTLDELRERNGAAFRRAGV